MDTDLIGLSENEAAIKLKQDGYNEIASSQKKPIYSVAFEVIKEPMFLLLLAGCFIYFLLGDIQEALFLLSTVFVVVGITFYQNYKTERTLETLCNLASPRAKVLRDGQQKRIPGREVVKDDILILSEGNRVPADAQVLSCHHLSVDESLLTGESIPVRKTADSQPDLPVQPGGEDLPFIFSGTLIVQGHAVARVLATGNNAQIGKIGQSLNKIKPEKTLLQKEIDVLVRNFALAGVFLCVLAGVVYSLTSASLFKGLLAGITLSMTLMPEELTVVLTIFLTLGAWRISQKRVLTRRIPVIETLGSATVLCVDKTGTLTLNSLAVSKLFTNSGVYDLESKSGQLLPEKFHELTEYAILASQTNPFDPTEQAIQRLNSSTYLSTHHFQEGWKLLKEYPLSKKLLALSNVWKSEEEKRLIVAAKGAPEVIADLCHLSRVDKDNLLNRVDSLAKQGLRVLGVAKAESDLGKLPHEQHDFHYHFLGLIALTDPLRPTVKESLALCYQAGIRVVLITGDYPATAQWIAQKINLKNSHQYIDGSELDSMSDEELRLKIKTMNIFARVVPEQKLRLVNALKANGEVVAMTGDGVNDAPALKAAHIGIAMGKRGTDVAREAASLVLLDDDFSSIIETVKMGRRIYDNLKKAITYIFAVHIPIAGIALVPIIFKNPLVFLPIHIAFLELIIDPTCSTVFEAEKEETNIMNRPPHRLAAPLFSPKSLLFGLGQGLISFMVVLGVFVYSTLTGQSEQEIRTVTFITLIISNLGLISANLTRSHHILHILHSVNKPLWLVLSGASTVLFVILSIPPLRMLFHFSSLSTLNLIVALSAGLIGIIGVEILKMARHKPIVLSS